MTARCGHQASFAKLTFRRSVSGHSCGREVNHSTYMKRARSLSLIQFGGAGAMHFILQWKSGSRGGRIPIVFYTGDGEHVSKSLLADMSLNHVPIPLSLVEPATNESNAAGQFFIPEAMQLGSRTTSLRAMEPAGTNLIRANAATGPPAHESLRFPRPRLTGRLPRHGHARQHGGIDSWNRGNSVQPCLTAEGTKHEDEGTHRRSIASFKVSQRAYADAGACRHRNLV